MKFKVGDRVVLVKEEGSTLDSPFGIGSIGTISEIDLSYRDTPYVIRFDNTRDDYEEDICFREDEMEFIPVYNSPLYQALK